MGKEQFMTRTKMTLIFDRRAQKGSFFGAAASQGIAIVFPDTSPRGAGIEGEDDSWDFGTGAGFYLDATNPKYSKHYNMATFVRDELPKVIEAGGLPIVSHYTGITLPFTLYLLWTVGLRPPIHLWP